GLGTRFEIMEASIKKWCVGSPIQAALDAAMELLKRGLEVDAIDKIDLIMPDDRLTIVDNRDMPDVCLQHMVAVALIDGGATFKTSHDKVRMCDPQVRALRAKMTAIPSPELSRARPARQAVLEISTRDGTRFRHHTKVVYGTPGNPMSPEDVEAKALELMVPVLGEAASASLARAIWSLERVENIRTLAAIAGGE
ncbi:MAG: MmgE/PrpD family protein, partial [Pseudomonadota bacterium]